MLDHTTLRMASDALTRVRFLQGGLKRGDMKTSTMLVELDRARTELTILLDRLKRENEPPHGP